MSAMPYSSPAMKARHVDDTMPLRREICRVLIDRIAAIDDAGLKQGSQTVKSGFGDAVLVEIEGLAPTGDAAKDGRLIGVLDLDSPRPARFSLQDQAAIERLAEIFLQLTDC